MRPVLFSLTLIGAALGERPFLNEADTGWVNLDIQVQTISTDYGFRIDDVFGDTPAGELVPLDGIVGLPDFEWAARRAMSIQNYTYYRNGAGGEWSYRNNLEIHNKFPLRPRMMVDILDVESTLPYVAHPVILPFARNSLGYRTTILGHNVSAPFFISPCSRGAYGNPEGAERGLVEGAASKNILYMVRRSGDLTGDVR